MPYNFEKNSLFLRNTSCFLRISNICFLSKKLFLFFYWEEIKNVFPPFFPLKIVVLWREECILRIRFYPREKKSHEFKVVIFCFNKHIFFSKESCKSRIFRHFFIRLCTQHCSHCLSNALLKVACNINCIHKIRASETFDIAPMALSVLEALPLQFNYVCIFTATPAWGQHLALITSFISRTL